MKKWHRYNPVVFGLVVGLVFALAGPGAQAQDEAQEDLLDLANGAVGGLLRRSLC